MKGLHQVIAIDGPAASGKSSVARALAAKLSIAYVNTGAMYRAVAWHVLQENGDADGTEKVRELFQRVKIVCAFANSEGGKNRESTICVNGVNPAAHLHETAVNDAVSKIARIPEIRHRLVEKQRTLALEADVVMEGRDIGTAVFPETPFKFYIDASPEVRAQRRARQGIHDDLANRDLIDKERKTSPLAIADDATIIDSTHLTIEGVVDEILAKLHQKNFSR